MPGVWRLHRYHGRRNRCCFLHHKSNHSRIRCYCRIHSHSHIHNYNDSIHIYKV